MSVGFNPYSHETQQNPHPRYAWLREQAPLYRNDELDFWALSRHTDVTDALRNHEQFSNRNGIMLEPGMWGPQAKRTSSFLAMDPPEHTRIRRLISPRFTSRQISSLEPHIRAIARTHLDPLLQQDTADLVKDYAAKLPMDVICELVGVPKADREQLRKWADLVVHRPDNLADLPAEGADARQALARYMTDLVADQRRQNRRTKTDIASALVAASDHDDQLTDQQIISILHLLIAAGNETTTNLISNAWYCAWRHSDQHQAARTRVSDWVAETLRLEAATQAVARTAASAIARYDAQIPIGARVLLLIGSANRDPRVFHNPDTFDLDRDTSQAIGFGLGRHYCLGAHLARLQARIALEELTANITGYDIDLDNAVRIHSANVRGFTSLPTTLTPK